MAAKIESKAPLVLGIGVVLGGIFLLFRKKKPAGEGIAVTLKNPPAGSTGWDLYLYGANDTHRRLENLAINESAVWEDIAAEELPFQVTLDIWKIEPAPENLLHHAQSRFPDYMNYYPDLLIHSPGAYNYNCVTVKFE